MGTFRDKFSLSYLNPRPAQQTSSAESLPGMEEALLIWGRRVTEALNSAPNQSLRVFDIVDKLNTRIDVLLPVVSYLTTGGYLARVEEDSRGNDLLKLTDRGKKLLA